MSELDLCDPNQWSTLMGVVYALDQVLEWWLGKTEKIKSSSKIELLINTVRKIILLIKPKGGDNGINQ